MKPTPIIHRAAFWASLAVLAAMTVVILVKNVALFHRVNDKPPTIQFTWTPLGEVKDLRDFRGKLVMKDDYGLDFKTYKMTIEETGKTYDLPIPGMLGKEYDSDISLGLLADNSKILDKGQVTIDFSIADDAGHVTSISKVIKVMPATEIQMIPHTFK